MIEIFTTVTFSACAGMLYHIASELNRERKQRNKPKPMATFVRRSVGGAS